MAVIVSHAQIQKVKDALASVASNAQALAAVDAAVKAAGDLAKHLREVGGPIREVAAKDIGQYADRVKALRPPLAGNPTGAVGESWTKAREQILNLYMLVFTVESTMPAGEDFGDGWGRAISIAVDELPATIGKAAKVSAKVVNTVVTEAASVGGSLVWGIVKGAWPLLAVLAAVGIGYVVLKGKLVKAVLP